MKIRFLLLLLCLYVGVQAETSSPSLQESQVALDQKFKTFIHYESQGQNSVGYVAVKNKSAIDQSTAIYIRRALDYYKKVKPIFIILELNTPGGELFAAEEISDALKEMDVSYGIPVVAYINNWAISAGAMLAYSCRFIVISKDASMGAAEPVITTQTGEMQSASEKVNSAVRADFANRASFFDRNPFIAEAMVDKEVILVMRQGQIVKLDNESQIISSGADPDEIITLKGRLLTLNREQLIRYGVADQMLMPMKLEPITEIEESSGRWPASRMLLFHAPLFDQIPNAEIEAYQPDWKESFFAFLAQPIVTSLLFLGVILGLYIEFNTPGASLPGVIALICLALILLSSFSSHTIHWLEVIILLTGVFLVLLEIFILPGFGFPGILGIILTIAGLFLIMLPSVSSFDFTLDPDKLTAIGTLFFERLGWLCATLLVGIGMSFFLGRFFLPTYSRWSRLVLRGEQESSQGYVAGPDLSLLPKVGASGEAFSPLRPSGKVLIDGHIYDAMSQGRFIERGASIVVLRYDGSIMIVGLVV